MSAIEVSEDSNPELSKPAGCESCFLESPENGLEGACYVLDALKGVLKPPTYEVACKIVSNNGVFTRQDIIHDLAYSGNPAALYKRFQVAISFIRSSEVLSLLLKVSGKTSTRKYRLDAGALPTACSKIREGASLRDQVSEADRNNTSDSCRTDNFKRPRSQNQRALDLLAESTETLVLNWGSENAGAALRRVDAAYGGMSRKVHDSTTDYLNGIKQKNMRITTAKQRQMIINHKNEVDAGIIEISRLSPDGAATWDSAAAYLSGGKELPAVYEAPLADLILIYDNLRDIELAIDDSSSFVSARIKHVRGIINDLFNVWELEFKRQSQKRV